MHYAKSKKKNETNTMSAMEEITRKSMLISNGFTFDVDGLASK